MIKKVILCPCHKEPVRTVVNKKTGKKKYYCTVKGTQLFGGFIHATAKIDLPEIEEEERDFKKEASGNNE